MENIITYCVLQNKHILFNGLYLLLKNPESIQSMSQIFQKQSPWLLNIFAAADERLNAPPTPKKNRITEKAQVCLDTAHFECVVKQEPWSGHPGAGMRRPIWRGITRGTLEFTNELIPSTVFKTEGVVFKPKSTGTLFRKCNLKLSTLQLPLQLLC